MLFECPDLEPSGSGGRREEELEGGAEVEGGTEDDVSSWVLRKSKEKHVFFLHLMEVKYSPRRSSR